MASSPEQTRTVQEIVEQEISGDQVNGIALTIWEIQNNAQIFADEWRDQPVREYHGIDERFYALCVEIAGLEVRL